MARRKAPRADAAPFPMVLGDDGDFHDADENPKATAPQSAEASLAALQARFDAMANEMAAMREASVAATTYKAPKALPQAPAPVTFDDLPDPIDDKVGYATGLANKFATYMNEKEQYEKAQRELASTQENRVETLWSEFSKDENYAPYAEDQTRVEFAASKAVEKAVARGMDGEAYMFKNRSGFYKDVVKEYDTIFGKPTLGDDEDDFDDDDGRTAGLAGGTGGKGRMSDAAETAGPDMFDTLREWQIKSGFHA